MLQTICVNDFSEVPCVRIPPTWECLGNLMQKLSSKGTHTHSYIPNNPRHIRQLIFELFGPSTLKYSCLTLKGLKKKSIIQEITVGNEYP